MAGQGALQSPWSLQAGPPLAGPVSLTLPPLMRHMYEWKVEAAPTKPPSEPRRFLLFLTPQEYLSNFQAVFYQMSHIYLQLRFEIRQYACFGGCYIAATASANRPGCSLGPNRVRMCPSSFFDGAAIVQTAPSVLRSVLLSTFLSPQHQIYSGSKHDAPMTSWSTFVSR